MAGGFNVDVIADAIRDLGLFDPLDAGPLAAYLFAEYGKQRDALVKTHYDALVSQFRAYPSQDILDRAESLAETAADSLLESMSKADLNAMAKVIANGIENGQHPREIARAMEQVQGLDANRVATFENFREALDTENMTPAQISAAEEREFQRLLRERRESIATTESARAVSEGDRLDAINGGAKYKVWQTTGDEVVSDECQANEAAGPIPIDEEFPGGTHTAPQHPNCRCSVSYVTSEESLPAVTELSEAAAQETKEAKEFNK